MLRYVIGASLSEPHTSELNGGIFLIYICMYVSHVVRPRDSLCSPILRAEVTWLTRDSMPMRAPARRTGTYSGSAKTTHANKSGFGFVEVYMQAKTNKSQRKCRRKEIKLIDPLRNSSIHKQFVKRTYADFKWTRISSWRWEQWHKQGATVSENLVENCDRLRNKDLCSASKENNGKSKTWMG